MAGKGRPVLPGAWARCGGDLPGPGAGKGSSFRPRF